MKKLLVLRHEDDPQLGTLDPIFDRLGWARHFVYTYRGDPLPPPAGFDGLLVMGGDMGVYENHPYLNAEMAYMKDWMARTPQKPLFGICLGCQMLAQVTGSRVFKGQAGAEVGFVDIAAVPPNPLELPESFRAFQWHGDTFSLGEEATWSARGTRYAHQGVVVSPKVMGVQFHPEMTLPMIREWYAESAAGQSMPIPDNARDLEAVLATAAVEIPRVEKWLFSLMEKVFS